MVASEPVPDVVGITYSFNTSCLTLPKPTQSFGDSSLVADAAIILAASIDDPPPMARIAWLPCFLATATPAATWS